MRRIILLFMIFRDNSVKDKEETEKTLASVSQQLLQLQLEAQEAENLQNQKQVQKKELQSTIQAAFLQLNSKYEQTQTDDEKKRKTSQTIITDWSIGKAFMEEENKMKSELQSWKSEWESKRCKK
jgi:MinD-like ATPase involved in chromosome partitioning or flagellar assembly